MSSKSEYQAISMPPEQLTSSPVHMSQPKPASITVNRSSLMTFAFVVIALLGTAFISSHVTKNSVMNKLYGSPTFPSTKLFGSNLRSAKEDGSFCRFVQSQGPSICYQVPPPMMQSCYSCLYSRTIQPVSAYAKAAPVSSSPVQEVIKANKQSSELYQLPASVRQSLRDTCNELNSFFSYGCWNSAASDTDLCLICKGI